MEGGHVSRLVAAGFLEHANVDFGITDYHHLATYFDGAIKQSYCTKFPIDETLGHSSATAATIRTITGSWTANKCTHTNWSPKHGTTCYNSMGAPSIHLP
jgi:hypothetical protein